MYESDGKTFIKYRDDETQGNKDKGDTAEKEAGELWKDAEGNYAFRGSPVEKFFWVQAAVSESKPPTPTPGGGIAEAMVVGSDSAAQASGSSSASDYTAPLAAVAAGVVTLVALGGGGWYARRRWLR
jgi:hypothetical protein